MHIKEIETLEQFKEQIHILVEQEYHKSNYDFSIEKKWITGGVGGGSCWDEGSEDDEDDEDNDPHYEIFGEGEPEDNTIETILKNMLPEISLEFFLKKNDVWIFWEFDSYSDDEYYGNSTDYETKTLKLDVLFERLKEIIE
jgi:hypothetical protein